MEIILSSTERDNITRLVTYHSQVPYNLNCENYEPLVLFQTPKRTDDHNTDPRGGTRDGFKYIGDITRWREDIEDITCLRVDMNFIFEWSTRYLTSERSERVRYRVDHEKIKFISISGHVMFCLLYKHQ